MIQINFGDFGQSILFPQTGMNLQLSFGRIVRSAMASSATGALSG